MERRYKVTSAPASEPVNVTETKNFLKVSTSADDDLITALIVAARQEYERYTNQALITQTIEEKFDQFPVIDAYNPDGIFELTVSPVSYVSSIQYKNTSGNNTTLSSSNYIVDTHTKPCRIAPAYSVTFPDTYDEINAVTITYVAGFGNAAAVPQHIKQVLYLLIADMYENRQDGVRRYRTAAERLMNMHKIFEY